MTGPGNLSHGDGLSSRGLAAYAALALPLAAAVVVTLVWTPSPAAAPTKQRRPLELRSVLRPLANARYRRHAVMGALVARHRQDADLGHRHGTERVCFCLGIFSGCGRGRRIRSRVRVVSPGLRRRSRAAGTQGGATALEATYALLPCAIKLAAAWLLWRSALEPERGTAPLRIKEESA